MRGRSPRRQPLLIGARSYRLLGAVPAWILFGAAASLTLTLSAPDLPFGGVGRVIGMVGSVFSLMLCISPVALVIVAAFLWRRVRAAIAMRACDLVIAEDEVRVVGGPAHGFRASLRDLAASGGVELRPDALLLRRSDGVQLRVPMPLDADERASLEALAAVIGASAATRFHGGAPPSPRAEAHTIRCAGCGASQTPVDAPAVCCPFCGVDNPVSVEVAAKLRAAARVDRQHQKDEALVRALLRQPSAPVANAAAFLGGGAMIVGAAIAAGLSGAMLMIDGREAGVPRMSAIGLVEIGLALLVIAFVRRTLANRRALRTLTLGFASAPPERAGAPDRCRTCGASLPEPGPRDLLTRCLHCDVENLRILDLSVQAEIVERFSAGAPSPGVALADVARRRRNAARLAAVAALVLGAGFVVHLREPSPPAPDARTAQVPHDDRARSFHDTRAAAIAQPGAATISEVAVVPGRIEALAPGARGSIAAVVSTGGMGRVVENPVGAVSSEALAQAPVLPIGTAYARRSATAPWLVAEERVVSCIHPDGARSIVFGDGLFDDPIVTDVSAGPGCSGFVTTRAGPEGHLRLRLVDGSGARLVRSDAREGALAPDGQTVAATVLAGRRERFHLVVFRREHPDEARLVTIGEGHVAVPAWSPDGRRVAFLSQSVRDAIQFSRRTGWVHLFVSDLAGGISQLTAGGDLALVRPVWTERGIFVATEQEGHSRIHLVVPGGA